MSKTTLPVVLVVDSDATSLRTTRDVLGFHDYNVCGAGSRESAIKAARLLPLDLIICEVQMPTGVAGCSIIREICAMPDRQDVPVMFTSIGQIPDIIRRTHDFGGAYHLKKPFDPDVLIELVERALWMPALVRTHVSRPHFQIGPAAPHTRSEWASPIGSITLK